MLLNCVVSSIFGRMHFDTCFVISKNHQSLTITWELLLESIFCGFFLMKVATTKSVRLLDESQNPAKLFFFWKISHHELHGPSDEYT